MDELHKNLTVCEMWIKEEYNPSQQGASLTASQKTIKGKQESKPSSNCCEEEEFSGEEISKFIINIKRVTCKFKSKLPLVCFDCGEIGHFAAKCPYKDSGNEGEAPWYGKKGQRRFNKQGKRKGFKKSFFSK